MSQRVSPIATAAWPAVGIYFWALLGASVLALGSLYAALIFASASWADTQVLNRIYPDEGMCIRQFSAVAWRLAQQLAVGVAGLAVLGWLGLGLVSRLGRLELAAVAAELRQLPQRCRQLWRDLTPGQRRVFGGHLVVLTCVRVYLSWTLLWHDDGASYALFVRHGLLAVTAYYPAPNNHLLVNATALAFSKLHTGFWWSMRLPVLLTSTAGTVLLFGVAVRRLGYWPALLAAGAASWLHPSLYYAGNGRGYWAALLLTGAVFWAVLVLQQPRSSRAVRLPWLVLVGAGVLGSYAVPTFAYVVVSAWSWLGLVALYRGWGTLSWQLLVSAALVMVGVGLLYAPLLYVSGPAALMANSYVQRLPAAAFWSALPAYLWSTESYLGGQYHVGAVLTLVALGLAGALVWQTRTGRLAKLGPVVGAALWFEFFPYGILLGQQVLPPERVFLYKAWFGFLLLALAGVVWRWTRPQRWLLGWVLAAWALYQLVALLGDNRRHWLLITRHRREYTWLAQHAQTFFPPGRVVSPCRPSGPPAAGR